MTVTARINEQIGAHELRVVDEEGGQVGVLARADALAYADERGLDLVEVAAAGVPPGCRVIAYGKWRYEEERRLRASRRNQVHVTFKEVRLRPRIGRHDYEWKRDRAAEFLRDRSKVKLVVLFRGREREHSELGRQLIAQLAADVQEFGHVEGGETWQGSSITVVLTPNSSGT